MIDLSEDAKREFDENPFKRRYRAVVFFSIFLVCCLSRLILLEEKSLMHDETLFLNSTYYNLYERFDYVYQPILHGPAMLHLQNLVFHIFGPSDFTVRLGCALLGIFGFFWIWKMRYFLGEIGTWFALTFYTLSPGIMFYQRFFRNDALFLFTSLWIVASLANWWRTKDGRWAASLIFACTVLFTNKESSLFIYFTVVTFVVLVLVADFTKWLFDGKADDLKEHLLPAPRFPNPFWPAAILVTVVTLCLTQIFEGIRYDSDVRNALGHDWILKDIRSIPLALEWMNVSANQAPDAGVTRHGWFWRLFYGALIGGSLVGAIILKAASDLRLGYRELATSAWRLIHEARYWILGAAGLSVAFYLLMFTTFLRHETGFFEIYSKTWSYWGGQHEWGRIAGPFHQHMLNTVIYEFPALIIVTCVWIAGMFRVRPDRSLAVAVALMLIPVAAFHKLMFSDMYTLLSANTLVPLGADYLKNIIAVGLLASLAILLVPRAARIVIPASLAGLVIYFQSFLHGDRWAAIMNSRLYQNGQPVELKNEHVTFAQYIEIQFNMDGGWNLMVVLILVFFATYYSWIAIGKGRRFEALLVWWAVTSIGAASYAREAVSQVGIHAMLPLILTAGVYSQRIFETFPLVQKAKLSFVAIGILALWNMKAAFNLNFVWPDDPRERMVYGPNAPETRDHLLMIREYNEIAGIRLDNGTPQYIRDYNDVRRFKTTTVYMQPIDSVTWPAKWHLRDIEYEEGNDVARAIRERYDFIFMRIDEKDKHPELEEHYNVHRGRGTIFWMPNPLSAAALTGVWANMIPGHYLDNTPQASVAYDSQQEWKKVRRYLTHREVFDGHNRPFPSMSSVSEYYFAFRKDLY